jgi:hypothetical protein
MQLYSRFKYIINKYKHVVYGRNEERNDFTRSLSEKKIFQL